MLPVHCDNGLFCPFTVRGSVDWQARHICPFELSRTRKFCDMRAIDCTCGEWQLVHSTLPLINWTALVGPAGGCAVVSAGCRSGASVIGRSRLQGSAARRPE